MLQPVVSVAGVAARSAIRYCAPGFQVLVGAAATYVAGVAVGATGYYGFKGIRRMLGREALPVPPVTPPPPATKHTKAAKPTIAPELAPVT